jgi:hypothetical protein
MKLPFRLAPIGSRYQEGGETFVILRTSGQGLVVQLVGNDYYLKETHGRQSYCCWVDEYNGVTLDTEVELISDIPFTNDELVLIDVLASSHLSDINHRRVEDSSSQKRELESILDKLTGTTR